MKKILTFTILLLALTACTAPQAQTPEPVATDESQLNMPNPAATYCEQNGYEYEIRTADDGSQSGVCVFLDGNTCEEWAYYRGECGPATQENPTPALTGETSDSDPGGDNPGSYIPAGATEEVVGWWGVIKSTEPGAQFDDYFERQDLGQIITFGIDSIDPAVQEQIKTLRDSGKIVHLYGTLVSNAPDYNCSQIQVDRIVVEG